MGLKNPYPSGKHRGFEPHLAYQLENYEPIEWDKHEEIGVEDCCDICTKRKIWWMRTANNQVRKVADINVTVNPFPAKGQAYYRNHVIDINTADGLEYIIEHRIYANAMIQAGQWLGEVLGDAKRVKN
jgi:hypothetical protein